METTGLFTHQHTKRVYILLLMVLMNGVNVAQETSPVSQPKKGSYLYYGQPAIEDNSFLLEEAFNQPMGVIQHISNFNMDKLHAGNYTYSFTQEIPLTNRTHQISYTLYYNILNPKNQVPSNGFGDVFISYRPLLFDENDWAMVIPRFTLILPTGRALDGLGAGGWGGQFNLAVTKRLSPKLVSHYNAGFTLISKADKYQPSPSTDATLAFERNLHYQNIGASIVWYPIQKLNAMLEYVSNMTSDIQDNGTISQMHQLTINPGFRFCMENEHMQVVPGMSFPINFENGTYTQWGVFLYLSIETNYMNFKKIK